jgi:ABC-type transporter lipoprotein component MlaA
VNPLTEPYSVIEDSNLQLALGASGFVVQSPSLLDLYTKMKGSAIDPYSALKNGYLQKRRNMIEE